MSEKLQRISRYATMHVRSLPRREFLGKMLSLNSSGVSEVGHLNNIWIYHLSEWMYLWLQPRTTTTRRVVPHVRSEEELTEKKPPVSSKRAFAVRSRGLWWIIALRNSDFHFHCCETDGMVMVSVFGEGGVSAGDKCQVDVLLVVDSSGSVHNIYDTQKVSFNLVSINICRFCTLIQLTL